MHQHYAAGNSRDGELPHRQTSKVGDGPFLEWILRWLCAWSRTAGRNHAEPQEDCENKWVINYYNFLIWLTYPSEQRFVESPAAWPFLLCHSKLPLSPAHQRKTLGQLLSILVQTHLISASRTSTKFLIVLRRERVYPWMSGTVWLKNVMCAINSCWRLFSRPTVAIVGILFWMRRVNRTSGGPGGRNKFPFFLKYISFSPSPLALAFFVPINHPVLCLLSVITFIPLSSSSHNRLDSS